jgi:hypothetical protein
MCHFAGPDHPINHTLYLTDTFSAASPPGVGSARSLQLGRYFRGGKLKRYAVTGPCVDRFMRWCLDIAAVGLPHGTLQTTSTSCSDKNPAQIQLVWEKYQGEREEREAGSALRHSTPSEAFRCLQVPGLLINEDNLRRAKELLMKMMPDYRPRYKKRI